MGLYVKTTVTVPAKSYALTDLATVSAELNIKPTDTANNTFLSGAITQVSTAAANYCNRVFPVEGLTDSYFLNWATSSARAGTGFITLQLSRWPVIAMISVTQTVNGSPVALVENTDYVVDYSNGQITRLSSQNGQPTNWEPYPVTVSYAAGYGAAVQQTAAVPATPFAINVTNSGTFAVDLGVSYVSSGQALTPVASAPAQGQYMVAAGLYTFNAADTTQQVKISYAYTVIPDDLAMAALRLITMRFHQRSRDPMLMSQSQPNLGDQRWWVGSQPGQNGAFPPEVAALLDNYGVPAFA